MSRKSRTAALALVLAATVLLALPWAADAQNATTYKVTVTNITAGQLVSPPVVVAHNREIVLWEVGEPALPEVASIAEDGDSSGLEALLDTLPQVHDWAVAGAPLPPGESVTLLVDARFPFSAISALGMLGTTNDAFFGLDSVEAPLRRRLHTHYVPAYDAGTEENNELCAFIPGPPCGNQFVRATEGAEGFVHVHRGMIGIGDLLPEVRTWSNPVVRVEIQAAP